MKYYETLSVKILYNSFLYYMDDIHSQFAISNLSFVIRIISRGKWALILLCLIQDAPVIIAQSGRERENVE